ncbi:MAG TPA: cyclic 2,3-diphosphoglycerate synthase [Acidobacteriota bacterium]|nr:cyclic 2,3-diphosphoglycerate synthase [Acidobacteriota bacterium]
MSINVIIMGAAGRDFHNFNVYFRDNEKYNVVAITATQIPDIEGRRYPAALAGNLYPDGIPIESEDKLEELIRKHNVEQVVFAYSDVPHQTVMDIASRVLAWGADFRLMGTEHTMVKSTKPVISVCAVRTGCGKSQTTRRVAKVLKSFGKKIAVIRHPMPYGDLEKQRVQRFASLEDMKTHGCTIEEMEEYEPHIVEGSVVFAGVDYEAILREAEKEADVILWDGGNNDYSFYKSDYEITVVDPHRVGHELSYYPGQTNLWRADCIVINKIETADPDDVIELRENIAEANPDAVVIDAASPFLVSNSELIRGKRVLVIEDGPTLTHGEMQYGVGVIAAYKFGAAELVDPRPYAVGTIAETFVKYPDVGELLPAMGYGEQQVRDLESTINATECDVVIVATPIDLQRIVKVNKPTCRVTYELQEIGRPTLEDVLRERFAK